MNLLSFLRTQVRANRLANHRLYQAMAKLSDDEMHAPRTSFFSSLTATLDHILWVDVYYLDCLAGRADARTEALRWLPRHDRAVLAAEQCASDERFIALLDAATEADLDRLVTMPRREHLQHEPMANVVAHLVNHQVHHRGQVHAMLAGTAVKPPQLDEFLMRSEAHLRNDDLAALGWQEAQLFGP